MCFKAEELAEPRGVVKPSLSGRAYLGCSEQPLPPSAMGSKSELSAQHHSSNGMANFSTQGSLGDNEYAEEKFSRRTRQLRCGTV